MAQTEPASHSPPDAPKRPKGILKNSNSFQHASPEASHISPTSEVPPTSSSTGEHNGTPNGRPSLPDRNMSEKEITQMNTELNAGAGHRRNSSNARGSLSRRQSSQGGEGQYDEQNSRLKWDEANLYLNEGQMGGRMKIDEPKTPYAKQYDPTEDEEELSNLNAQDLAVDELEMERGKQQRGGGRPSRDADIPGLDLGEPEMDPADTSRRDGDGEGKVIVESDDMDIDGGAGHGEKREEDMSREEREKHKRFEAMRKRHYEMKDVKNLLGHAPEEMEPEDNDDGAAKGM